MTCKVTVVAAMRSAAFTITLLKAAVVVLFAVVQVESLSAVVLAAQTAPTTEAQKQRSNSDFSYFRVKRPDKTKTAAEIAQTLTQDASMLPYLDVSALHNILLHDGGRVQPFTAYARNTLLSFNGRSTFKTADGKHYDATAWLAHTIFEPELAFTARVFRLTYLDVLSALGLTPHKSKRYSFKELSQSVNELKRLAEFAQSKQATQRSSFDKEVLRLYENYLLYYQLLSSFVYALPSETFAIPASEVRTLLGLNPQRVQFSYLELMEVSEQLQNISTAAVEKPQAELSSEERIIITLAQRYQSFPRSFADVPFRFFPSYSHGEERWFSPWQLFLVNAWENLVAKEIAALKAIVSAYRNGDQAGLDEAAAVYKAYIQAKLQPQSIATRADWEWRYYQLDPFYRSSILYGLAFLTMLGFFAFPGRRNVQRRLKQVAGSFMFIALVLTLGGIIMRMVITNRPPITNLFSTFTFVALITALGGLILERYERGGVGLVAGALGATLLLLTSNYFAMEGDTLHVLVAVLRSNFWLTLHVIAINLGYAGIVLSGLIAHVYLLKRIYYEYLFKRAAVKPSSAAATSALIADKRAKLRQVLKLVYGAQAFGLIFSVFGTILGGVWADQSWGRFWGWDPKENGSLLIVLWSAILFHSKFGGLVRDLGFTVGAVMGIVVVMFAWFGINLLGVGLHSYGFTEGIAYPLILYIFLQFTVLFFLIYFIKLSERMRLLSQQS